MTAGYIRKYRGFPSLTPEVKAAIIAALKVGAPIEIACEAAGIVVDTFYRWMRAGRALHLGEQSSDLPDFKARQPDEADAVWDHRKAEHDHLCDELEDIFLKVRQARAKKRLQWIERMDKRALEDDDMIANAWLLERTVPEHFALVTTNRKEIDAKVEVTHKSEVEAFAELYALLGHGHQQALPDGQQIIHLPEGDVETIDPDHD